MNPTEEILIQSRNLKRRIKNREYNSLEEKNSLLREASRLNREAKRMSSTSPVSNENLLEIQMN